MKLMKKILSFPEKRLDLFIKNSFEEICSYLDINTELVLSSDIEKNNTLKGQDKILEICRLLHADTYYNAIGGKDLYDKKKFADKGISLVFLRTKEGLQYKQFSDVGFVPNLSLIDVLMFNSKERVNEMLGDYILE